MGLCLWQMARPPGRHGKAVAQEPQTPYRLLSSAGRWQQELGKVRGAPASGAFAGSEASVSLGGSAGDGCR